MLLVLQACVTTPGSGSDGDRVQSFLQTRPALSSSPLPPHFLETPCGTVLHLLPHLPFYGHLPITVYTALASAVFSLKQPTLAPGMMGCPCHLTGRLLTREFSSCCHSLSLPSPQLPGSSFCCHRSPKTAVSRLTLASQRSVWATSSLECCSPGSLPSTSLNSPPWSPTGCSFIVGEAGPQSCCGPASPWEGLSAPNTVQARSYSLTPSPT